MKDWTGNKNSVYKTLGASNHTDFYENEREAVKRWNKRIKRLEWLYGL